MTPVEQMMADAEAAQVRLNQIHRRGCGRALGERPRRGRPPKINAKIAKGLLAAGVSRKDVAARFNVTVRAVCAFVARQP